MSRKSPRFLIIHFPVIGCIIAGQKNSAGRKSDPERFQLQSLVLPADFDDDFAFFRYLIGNGKNSTGYQFDMMLKLKGSHLRTAGRLFFQKDDRIGFPVAHKRKSFTSPKKKRKQGTEQKQTF